MIQPSSHSVPWSQDYGHPGYAAVRRSNNRRMPGGLRRHPVIEAVGERFALRRCSSLVGMQGGQQATMGACWHNVYLTYFDWWFPYIGIALDDKMPAHGEAEVATKRAWCQEHMVIYFGPMDLETPQDWDVLRELSAERRGNA